MPTQINPPSLLPTEEQKPAYVRKMFDRIAKNYDLLNSILTLGMDTRWRRKTLKALQLQSQSQPQSQSQQLLKIADLACGTGDFLHMYSSQPGFAILGFDFSQEMLIVSKKRAARKRAAKKRAAKNLPTNQPKLICADINTLPTPDQSFDAAVMGFALRNLQNIPATLQEIFRILNPGAKLALLEVGIPKNPILKSGHSFYFKRIVPAIGRLLSDSTAYKYLPASVAYLPSPEKLKACLEAAGFHHIHSQPLSGGIVTLTTATK